jgi:hypothetical protein
MIISAENLDRWCYAWFEESQAHGLDRAGLWLQARWRPRQVITCSFRDGDPALRNRVEQVARQWTSPGRANLTLDFRDDTHDTDIRISFAGQGSWSVIGSTCRRVSPTEPTMNFGWLRPDSSDIEVERVVLHEFGHALGLVHEHQSPQGGIVWNKPAVYADLEGRWTREQIERNVFATVAPEEAALTRLDPASIMMYPIKKSWTLNGFSSSLNIKLSPVDIMFIRNTY